MADYSFISQNQQSPAVQNIRGMVDIASGMQNMQRGRVELDQARMDLEERNALRGYLSDPKNYTDESGNPDWNRMVPEITKLAPKLGPGLITQFANAQRDTNAATEALIKLDQDKRNVAGQYITSLAGESPENVLRAMTAFRNANPAVAPAIDYFAKYHVLPNMMNQKALKDSLLKIGISVSSPQGQETLRTGAYLSTGGENKQISPTAQAAGAEPTIPNTLAPSTQRFNPETNSYEYLGNPPASQPPAAPKPVQAAPALGTDTTATNLATTTVKDWSEVAGAAKNAAQNIGVLQEIKKYAPGAAKGVIADRRAFISGLAGLLGMDAGELVKTDTDLLAKNSNMLALAGGDTNLAKTMAEVANPNIHMTGPAIVKAANQVIGQQQLAIARQNFLAPFIDKPQEYQKKLAEFNSIADPRILQLPHLSVAEKAEMKNAMTERERKDFSEKIRKMQQLGILQ